MTAPKGDICTFRRTHTENPVLIAAADGSSAVTSLNGVIVPLAGEDAGFGTDGLHITVGPVDDWRTNSLLTFTLEPGPVGIYQGFWSC